MNNRRLADDPASRPKSPAIKRSDDEAQAETNRIDEAILALLLLGLHDGDRAWKAFDWEAMNRLHART